MSRAQRSRDLMAALALSQSDRDREIRAGQRQGETTSRWASALSNLVPQVAGVAGDVYGAAEKQAVDDAGAFAASKADVVDQEEADSIVANNPTLQPVKKEGNVVKDFFADPLGLKSRLNKTANNAATTSLSSSVKTNTATRAAKAAADAKASRETARINSANAATTEKANAAEAARKREDAINQLRGAMRSGASRAELERIAGSVGMDPDALLLAADEATTKQFGDARKIQSEIDRNNANATKALRAPPVKPGPSPEAIERQRKKDELLDLSIAEKKGNNADAAPLRKELAGLPAVKQYNDVAINYDKMVQSVEKPTAAGDLALIFSFMKMLDPGSTVREGEFATAQNAGGVDDTVVNSYNKIISGERLNDAQRREFLSQAGGFLSAQKRARDAAVARYKKIAERGGINPADVIEDDATGDADDPFADTRGAR